MLTIRFARHGRKKQAFFKLVAAESARAVKKKTIKELGHYNPLAEGGKGIFTFDAETIKKYIANGAQVSQTAARLLAKNGVKEAEKFIETRVMKPKKEAPKVEKEEVKEEAPEADAPAEVTEEVKEEAAPEAEETASTEATSE